MDAILGKEAVVIRNGYGEPLAGRNLLSNYEEEFHFYPKDIWAEGTYEVQVLSILEDLAGNNLNHLFDTKVYEAEGGTKEKHTTYKSMKFNIK